MYGQIALREILDVSEVANAYRTDADPNLIIKENGLDRGRASFI